MRLAAAVLIQLAEEVRLHAHGIPQSNLPDRHQLLGGGKECRPCYVRLERCRFSGHIFSELKRDLPQAQCGIENGISGRIKEDPNLISFPNLRIRSNGVGHV